MKAQELELGAPSAGQGIGLKELEKKSGYSWVKILNAAQMLGLKLRRTRRGDPRQKKKFTNKYSINDEQEAQIIAYMLEHEIIYKTTGGKTKGGVWGVGKKPPACVTCTRNDRPHYARGLCEPCYQKELKAQKHVKNGHKSDEGDHHHHGKQERFGVSEVLDQRRRDPQREDRSIGEPGSQELVGQAV